MGRNLGGRWKGGVSTLSRRWFDGVVTIGIGGIVIGVGVADDRAQKTGGTSAVETTRME